MLHEITEQIIEILNKTTTAVYGTDLENTSTMLICSTDDWENGRKRQAVVDTLNKLIDINQTNLDILYPDRNKVYAHGVPSNRVTVQYIK